MTFIIGPSWTMFEIKEVMLITDLPYQVLRIIKTESCYDWLVD